MKKITTILALFVLIGTFEANAQIQQDFVKYNMWFIPQAQYANPSQIPMAKFNLGLPGISNDYLAVGNSGFAYKDFFKKRSDDSLELDLSNAISKMKDKNYLGFNASIDLFYMGFRVKKNYFYIHATEKIDFTLTYPKGLFELLWEGNGGSTYLGNRASFDGLGVDFMHYRDMGLGYAREVSEKLSVGGKLRYLYGQENIYTKTSTWGLTTDEQTFDLTVDGKLDLKTSGVQELGTTGYDGSHLKGLNNKGFALDLGGTYKLNDKFSVNASLLDLGRIKWNNNIYNIESNDISFTFSGLDLYDLVGNNTDTAITQEQKDELNPFSRVTDSIQSSFVFTPNQKSYVTRLGPKIYLGGLYHLNEDNTVSAKLYTKFFKGKPRSGFSLSYNYRFKRFFSASLAYSAYNRSYFNLGAGLSLNAGPLQLYLVSDNLTSLFAPQITKNIHLNFGINITVGRRIKDSDGDKIRDNKDDCPETAGLEKFAGCPDTDNDNIPDKDDKCPGVYGLPAFGGCPDTDGDGVGDLEDGCIDIAGTIELKGCPDTDGDGIGDAEDLCPTKAGTVENNGCPDTDGDGIVDSMDECPEVKGLKTNFGCPPVTLMVLRPDGSVLMKVDMSDGGYFIFENLPSDQQYLFKLEGQDIYLSEELLIVLKNGADEKLIVAKQDENETHSYEYLPADVASTLKLFIVDETGKIMRVAYRDKAGQYVFENLDPDKQYLFRMEGQDTPGEMLNIVIKNKEQSYRMSIKPEKGQMFNYKYLPGDQNALALIEYSDEGKLVILDDLQKEVVDKAYGNLEFNMASAIIYHQSVESLDGLAELLNKNSGWTLVLTGHTDDTGDEISNLALSKRRAESIEKYMEQKGVDPGRIIIKYLGETQPLVPNDSDENRAKNRRVEMMIVEKE